MLGTAGNQGCKYLRMILDFIYALNIQDLFAYANAHQDRSSSFSLPTSASPSVRSFNVKRRVVDAFTTLSVLLNMNPIKTPPYFECPMHECYSCKTKGKKNNKETCQNDGQDDNKKNRGGGGAATRKTKGRRITRKMCLALCRRCPVPYHRKCLPRCVLFGYLLVI